VEEEPRQAKRQRTTQEPKAVSKAAKPEKKSKAPASAKGDAASKPKRAAGRPAKLKAVPEDAGETSFMELQKGPPMPKRRGLVSVKRDPDVIVQTRAGRQSYRPLHWWAGDKVITEVEEREDMFKNASGFVTQSTKEVFRAPEEEAAIKRGPRGRGRTKGKSRTQTPQVEDDEPPEDWELDRGVVEGEVMGWEPEYEKHPPADDDHVNVSEDLLAISADAVQTKDIKDATFRFAKTLTMPFMGAGIVDLPPGAEKRPKNSRKMHMVFFVHTGKVLVTVNETEFRISSGGQWFVPRGESKFPSWTCSQ
jgi:centromere protein C